MEKYITLTGMKHYDHPVFYPKDILRCVKEPKNPVDSEAVYAEIPLFGKVGYVANTWHTKAQGTYSAGRLYDTVEDEFYAELSFILPNAMIAGSWRLRRMSWNATTGKGKRAGRMASTRRRFCTKKRGAMDVIDRRTTP